jgi:uncharacterized protein
MKIPVDGPLDDAEFDRLGDYLRATNPHAMNIETLDGYFSALICGPAMVLPSEYLPEIFGADHSFDSTDEATEILGLLMRHWNTIAKTLNNRRKEDAIYIPVLIETEDGVAKGNDWANGFLRGVQAGGAGWSELINSDEHGGPLVTIMMLAHEQDADPAMRPPPIPDEKREEILIDMVAGIGRIYRYFAPHREKAFKSGPQRARTVH